MKRETASMALRYIEMRRELEALRAIPGGHTAVSEALKEARQNLVDAREGLALAVSKDEPEIGVQVLFVVNSDRGWPGDGRR